VPSFVPHHAGLVLPHLATAPPILKKGPPYPRAVPDFYDGPGACPPTQTPGDREPISPPSPPPLHIQPLARRTLPLGPPIAFPFFLALRMLKGKLRPRETTARSPPLDLPQSRSNTFLLSPPSPCDRIVHTASTINSAP